MKKSIYTKWHVWLTIIIFLALVVYLTIMAYRDGYQEARKYRIEMEKKGS